MTPYELLGRLPDLVKQLRNTPPGQVERSIFEVLGWCGNEQDLWKEATDAAVCMANTDGGIVLFGLDPQRLIDEAPPCPHEKVTPEWLEESVRNHSHPPVECTA